MQDFDPVASPLAGSNLIQAGAGTGKTYTIASIVLRLVLEHALPIHQILVVTFTEAATEELRVRIRARLQDALSGFDSPPKDPLLRAIIARHPDPDAARQYLRNALRGFDEAAVFTIHGFCRRMLQDNAFESGMLFDTELVTDQNALLQEVCEDFWRVHFYPGTAALVGYALGQGWSPQYLRGLLGNHLGKPFLQLTPDPAPVAAAVLERAAALYQARFEALREQWPQAREEVRRLLLETPGLSRTKYKAASIASWLERLHAYLDDPEAGFKPPEELPKFTPAELRASCNKGASPPEYPLFEACAGLLEAWTELEAGCAQHLLWLRRALFDYARRELAKRKQARNIQFFDDLLQHLHRGLHGPGGEALAQTLRRRYPAALIDEFQDTDALQYAIFSRVYADPERLLFLIGDPKQAIYSFRGADIFTYLQAAQDVDHNYTLSTNWRSSPDLIAGVNAVFQNRAEPFLFPGIEFYPARPADKPDNAVPPALAGPALHLWLLRREGSKTLTKEAANALVPQLVASEVARLLNTGAARAADIAVLVRKNEQARQIQRALQQRRVPAVVYSQESLFDSHEAQELERLLAALLEPNNPAALRAALCTDMLGLDGNRLFEVEQDEHAWDAWLERFQVYAGRWQRQGFMVMLRQLLAAEQVAQRLLGYSDGERRLTNLLHLAEVLQQAANAPRRSPARLYQWLQERRQRHALEDTADEYQLRLESDEHAVKLVTIHKSKGLEYPVTFVPYAWDGNLPQEGKVETFSYHDPEHRHWLDLGTPGALRGQHFQFALDEMRAENLRLLYVALTRAKYRCYLVWGGVNQAEDSALGYLLRPPGAPPLKDTGDAELSAELSALRARAPGHIELSHPEADSERYRRPGNPAESLRARSFHGHAQRPWQVSSFTSLSGDASRHDPWARHGGGEQPERDALAAASTPPPAPLEPYRSVFEFPAGARAGEFFHALLETLDFRLSDPELLARHLDRHLHHYGYAQAWQPALSQWLQGLLATPLGEDGLSLGQLAWDSRLNELEFYYPLAAVEPVRLNALLRPAGVELPEFETLHGFMKGYIDLVFLWRGRYYLVDYKSNRLGLVPGAYQYDALEAAMRQHRYDLQALIYSVALHRYLGLRLPDYACAEHFGGVYYLFLRGVSPATGPTCGVHFSRPDPDLLQRLSAYLGDGVWA